MTQRTYESARRVMLRWVFSRLSSNENRDDDLKQMFLLGWEAAFISKMDKGMTEDAAIKELLSEESDEKHRTHLLKVWNEGISNSKSLPRETPDEATAARDDPDSVDGREDSWLQNFRDYLRRNYSYAEPTSERKAA